MAFFVHWPVSDQCLWVKILFYSSAISYFSHAAACSVLALFSLSLVGLTPARCRKCMFRCNACLLAACFKFKRKEATCVPQSRLTRLTCTGSIFPLNKI